MKYIEAPEQYRPKTNDDLCVFMAGGITGCEDWQATVRDRLASDALILFNPRREDFDVTRGDSAEQQVRWEFEHLMAADLTMFWFPACDPTVTVQPIAMYELGAAAVNEERSIIVGADPDYPRRNDILLQLTHVRPELTVHDSLSDVVDAVSARAAGFWKDMP